MSDLALVPGPVLGTRFTARLTTRVRESACGATMVDSVYSSQFHSLPTVILSSRSKGNALARLEQIRRTPLTVSRAYESFVAGAVSLYVSKDRRICSDLNPRILVMRTWIYR